MAATFTHERGRIILTGAGKPLSIDRDMAESLRGIYATEASAGHAAGDKATADHAAGLWKQLTNAMDLHDMWQRFHAL